MNLKGYVCSLLMRFFGLLPLENKVVFQSFDGKMYSDNPRHLFEFMRKEKPELKYVWILRDTAIEIEGAAVVKKGSISSLFHLATAKLWIDNSRKNEWVVKRKKQYYVQTWHGDVCIKKIEKDAEKALGENYVKAAIHDSEMADLMVSGSEFRTNNYRNSFWYDGEILELGTPLSDIFYKERSEYIKRVYEFYKLKSSTKIAFYAPTFRTGDDMKCYSIDYKRLLECLNKKWSGEWVVIVRLHPKIQDFQNLIIYSEKILNGSAYDNFDELLISSEIIITDYSGGMFHAAEANKRVVLFATDIENFNSERGTYIDIRRLPFPLAESNEELEKNIISFNDKKYFEDVENLKRKLGYFNSATSTELVAQNILARIQWEEKVK